MRISLLLLLPLCLVCCIGCATQRPPPPPIESITLLDVQDLSGGSNLWFSRDGSATVEQAVLHISGRGLQASHYRAQLGAERFEQLQRLIYRSEFLRCRSRLSEHPGAPDEAHPIIYLVLQGGKPFCAVKWADDENSRFDPLYDALKTIIIEVTGDAPYEEVKYNWTWRPSGFPPPAEIIKCAE